MSMTLKEKTIKRLNGWENFMYSARARTYVFMKCFPEYTKGERRLNGKHYVRISPALFEKKLLKEDGSARPLMDSAFVEDCVTLHASQAIINTELRRVQGHGWTPKDGSPSKKIWRHAVTGMATSDTIFYPVGTYSALLSFDTDALGSWDAWWFLSEKEDADGEGYEEFDGIERFYGTEKESNCLTSSVHKGVSSSVGREVYNNSFNIPKNMHKVHVTMQFKERIMVVRVNGLLVFKGRQWMMNRKMSMIINSGIQEGCLNKAIERLRVVGNYTFEVSDIKHYRYE